MSTSTQTEQLTGTWTIDPSHSTVEFSVKHMMITTVKGRFGGVEGTVRTAAGSGDAWVAEVDIDASTIDTGSSAINSEGSFNSDLAMETRCSCPPENSGPASVVVKRGRTSVRVARVTTTSHPPASASAGRR